MLLISVLLLSSITPFASAALGGPTDPSSQILVTPEGDQSTTTSPPPNPNNNLRLLQPYQWKNWEDTVECQPAFLAYPSNVAEVSALVSGHTRVRVTGLGHSFNQLPCSSDLMISTEQLDHVLNLDTLKHTVTTQVGIKTRALNDWLANRGWALPTVPFYVDQTIGGAVATGSHGSSLVEGSLSSLVKAIKLVLADGSIRVLTKADGDLFEAAKKSVGLLGVVVELTLAVVLNKVFGRELDYVNDQDILADLKKAQVHSLGLDRVQYWYSPPLRKAAKSTIDDLGHLHQHKHVPHPNVGRQISDFYYRTIANSSLERPYRRLFVARWMQHPDAKVTATYLMTANAVLSLLPGKYKLTDVLPQQQVLATDMLQYGLGKYDQIEFAVPLDKAHECVSALFELMDKNVTNRDDFLVPFLWRYVGPAKEGLLGMSRGGARFLLNMDNYDVYKRGGFSQSFKVVKDLMSSQACQARLHFGKAGIYSPIGGTWTAADGQYVKDTVGPDSYKRFLAAAKTLDPTGKFADVQNLLIPK